MTTRYLCPAGHSWEGAEPTACPVCGAAGAPADATASSFGETLAAPPAPPRTLAGSASVTTGPAPDPSGGSTEVSGAGRPADSVERTLVGSGEPPAALASPAAPRLVEGYLILEQVGRGGMGVVYRARQEGLNRVVAIKTILAGTHAGDEELHRFRSEAEAVARLRHENIVQIYQVGTVEQGGSRLPYMALEFVEGGSLAAQIAGTPWPARRAAALVEKLARAVHSAHQAGVVHRDLKPANVLLAPDGTPKITDFGLAKRLDDDSGQTRSGSILGTPSYMAPEQARGIPGEVGPHTDVYALGAILYELLTGRPPFKATAVWDTVKQVIEQPPVPPTQLQGGAPRDLETICLKCLAKEPHRRYASAADLADDLRRFLDDKPILARPAGDLERAWRWCRRNPWLAGAVAAAVVALVAGTVVSSAFAVRSGENARRADEKARLAEENAAAADANARKADESARKATRLADYAARQRDMALESFGVLLTEVQERLKDSPEMRQVRDRLVETAANGLDRLGESSGDLAADRGLAEGRVRLAHAFERLGNLSAARRQYEAAIKTLDAVGREHPDDPHVRLLAAATRSDLGELIAGVDREASRSLVRSAVESLDATLKARPEDVAARQALATALARRGRQLAEDGDRPAAEAGLRRALALREELAAAAPDDAGRRLAVASACQALGDFLMPADTVRAAELYEKAEAIAAALVEKDPADRAAKARRAALAMGTGAALERGGLDDEAATAYRRAYRLQTDLLANDPFNAGVQFGAVRAAQKLGDLFYRTNDNGLGRDWTVTAFVRMTTVLAADPNNPGYLRAMRDVHRRAADLSVRWKGWVGARNHQRQALELTRKLAAADPQNPELQTDLLDLTRKLGESAVRLGHAAAAREHLTRTAEMARAQNKPDAAAAAEEQLKRLPKDDGRFTTNSVGLDLVRVRAGTFRMGGEEPPEAVSTEFKEPKNLFAPEQPAHEVAITRDLDFGATEVTRGQFRAFVEATGYRTDAEKDGKGVGRFNPTFGVQGRQMENWRAEGFGGMSDDLPVVGVSWNDAVAFCAWLSKKEGKTYRLPTEAEWEYACRAGTTTRYWTGDDPESLAAGANVPDLSYREANGDQGYATLAARDGYAGTAPVGEFAANPWGLYDTHGNVWEWCQDGYDAKFYERKVRDDPLAPPGGVLRVTRGGCFM